MSRVRRCFARDCPHPRLFRFDREGLSPLRDEFDELWHVDCLLRWRQLEQVRRVS